MYRTRIVTNCQDIAGGQESLDLGIAVCTMQLSQRASKFALAPIGSLPMALKSFHAKEVEGKECLYEIKDGLVH